MSNNQARYLRAMAPSFPESEGLLGDRQSAGAASAIAGVAADRRAIIQREAAERAALRQKRLADQVSALHEPHERIRIWEQLHALRLPLGRQHRLVRVIAAQTELTVRQVEKEQERRAAAAIPAAAP